MLRFHSYNIVFQEVPNEVTLAVNLSNCPNRCSGCHSPYLQEDTGKTLDESVIDTLLAKYGGAVTCLCFMGGDAEPSEVEKLCDYIKKVSETRLKTAWYSGKPNLPDNFDTANLDYLKLGPYIESLGGLDVPTSNQRFYKIVNRKLIDATELFYKKKINSVY
jgi:anaerobic ribonucleoside-triphosphate reductase activating protein